MSDDDTRDIRFSGFKRKSINCVTSVDEIEGERGSDKRGSPFLRLTVVNAVTQDFLVEGHVQRMRGDSHPCGQVLFPSLLSLKEYSLVMLGNTNH